MQRIFQAVPWLLAFAIVILSLGPPSVRPSTGAPHDLEHLLMFLATGVAFGFRYPHRLWFLAMAQVTFVGAIEIPTMQTEEASLASARALVAYVSANWIGWLSSRGKDRPCPC